MNARSAERGQAVVLILIVLAIIAGGYWMLVSLRDSREKDAHRFGREAVERLVLRKDLRFLNQRLAPRAQVLYPPSWRERFLGYVQALGPVQGDIEMEGHVVFTSKFFSPSAIFKGRFNVASGPASVEIQCSHTGVRWEIDAFNLIWTTTPTASPVPVSAITPSPSPTPTATPTPHRRK